ncbi:hypothetical protein MIH18_07700 [Marinobacter sp. M3C]|nr:hypothetical protein MIH18_07700 [Marinobacter sp. M3C]
MFQSLDAGIITAHDSEFGRYCFPQKLYEMVTCDLPIVAAKAGTISQTLQGSPEILFAPSNAKSLIEAIAIQLEKPYVANVTPVKWSELVQTIEPVISQLAK